MTVSAGGHHVALARARDAARRGFARRCHALLTAGAHRHLAECKLPCALRRAMRLRRLQQSCTSDTRTRSSRALLRCGTTETSCGRVFSPERTAVGAGACLAGLGSAIDRGLSRDPLTNKTFGASFVQRRGTAVARLGRSPGRDLCTVSAPAVLAHVLSAQTKRPRSMSTCSAERHRPRACAGEGSQRQEGTNLGAKPAAGPEVNERDTERAHDRDGRDALHCSPGAARRTEEVQRRHPQP